MKELSKEEILIDWHSDSEGDFCRNYNTADIIDAMEYYASQEKKKEAIEFAEWISDKRNGDKDGEDGFNPFIINNDCKWIQLCGNSTTWTTEQLYNLYIEHKNKKENKV